MRTEKDVRSFGDATQQYLIHEGPEEPARALLMAAGMWGNELHEEIYIYNQGYWQKNHQLWVEIQKANWHDIILKDEFNKGMKKDVFGDNELEVNIGPVPFLIDFQVGDIPRTFNLLLGRPWIHMASAIPSSLHQKV